MTTDPLAIMADAAVTWVWIVAFVFLIVESFEQPKPKRAELPPVNVYGKE